MPNPSGARAAGSRFVLIVEIMTGIVLALGLLTVAILFVQYAACVYQPTETVIRYVPNATVSLDQILGDADAEPRTPARRRAFTRCWQQRNLVTAQHGLTT